MYENEKCMKMYEKMYEHACGCEKMYEKWKKCMKIMKCMKKNEKMYEHACGGE